LARAEKAVDMQIWARHESLMACMKAKMDWQDACIKVEVAKRLRTVDRSKAGVPCVGVSGGAKCSD
jgi:hypothetical protein